MPHLCAIVADDDVRGVSPINERRVIVLIVYKNLKRGFHFCDDGVCADGADQQQPVALALLSVQRSGHDQLRGRIVHGERSWRVCSREAQVLSNLCCSSCATQPLLSPHTKCIYNAL